ncbi:MAG TPA: Ldh family oxidoreductase, partial [Terriglobales bacterium]|nr:Ldh family oxidoreductase [Terriglobales bacterium]
MPRFQADEIRALEVSILRHLGASQEHAELVVDMLIEASLVGHDSHGVHYITRYADRIKRGIIDKKAIPEITKETVGTAIVDGHWGFGQVTAKRAMEVAIEKAGRVGVGAVGCIHCNHIGRLGAYTSMAAEKGMVGLMVVNVVHPTVQPFGGASRVLGSNPISVAAPAGNSNPFLLDFATSAVAEGKIGWAAMKDEKIPMGWIVDHEGHDTNDPLDFSLPNG